MSGHEAEDDEGVGVPIPGVDESGVVASGSSEAELFRAGKLSREEFIAKSAERATSHLEGVLSASRLEDMRAVLRAQLDRDPTLAGLIETVAGGMSSADSK